MHGEPAFNHCCAPALLGRPRKCLSTDTVSTPDSETKLDSEVLDSECGGLKKKKKKKRAC